ncbi:alpha/beta fold hydrolase, partial [Streptomyces sp. NPDC058251]|uniref:alpha/beta fold hydrolase n=1 Tax=Streptomyces sp. NPDC058251 TaxID=3346404 RepID=UPI0036E1A5D9
MEREIELSAGTIEYADTGGDGPVLVLLHGLLMDASLWDGVVADLSADHRCVVPTLPRGGPPPAGGGPRPLKVAGRGRRGSAVLEPHDQGG